MSASGRTSSATDYAKDLQLQPPSRTGIATAAVASAAVGGGTFGTALAIGAQAAGAVVCMPAAAALAGTVGLVTKIFRDSSNTKAEIAARADMIKMSMDQILARRKEENKHELEVLKNGPKCGYPECGASFENGDQLTWHIQQCHTGFRCSIPGCDASFMDEDKLQQHALTGHSVFQCSREGCGAMFLDRNKLTQHVQNCHSG